MRLGVSDSYIWGLVIFTFGVVLLRLGVSDSYVLGLVFLRLGVSFFMFGVSFLTLLLGVRGMFHCNVGADRTRTVDEHLIVLRSIPCGVFDGSFFFVLIKANFH